MSNYCRYPGFCFETTNKRFYFYRLYFPDLIRKLALEEGYIKELTEKLTWLKRFNIGQITVEPTNKGWLWKAPSHQQHKSSPYLLRMSYETSIKLCQFLNVDNLKRFHLGYYPKFQRFRGHFKSRSWLWFGIIISHYCNEIRTRELTYCQKNEKIYHSPSRKAYLRAGHGLKTISNHALKQEANYIRSIEEVDPG